jgi:hypothetical protein
MSTSGFYRTTADLVIYCDICEWGGWVPAVEDFEDYTLSYTCKGCGAEYTESLGDGRDQVD